MVTMVVMVTVAKAKKYCINSKIGTQATIIRELRIAWNFYFKLAIFSTHTTQILGSIFKLREIINL